MLLVIALAYVVGSLPTGLALTWLWTDQDVRTLGSGNTGATNVARVAGRRLGAVTLAGDLLKGLVPVLVAPLASPEPAVGGAVALAAFTGHCWSVFLGFRGGKGVATAAGSLLALAPGPTLAALVTWGIVVRITRRASVAALVSAALLPVLCAALSTGATEVALLLAVGVGWRHRSNLSRLWSGTELSTDPP